MSNAAILASFAWQAAYSLAAPTPNTTTANPVADPGWKKEPKGRGTFSIILTSVLTLGLCVWTAIHPNVRPNASGWEKVKHRLFFVAVGMLAPEVVLAVAFYEWQQARKFHKEWCELYGIEPGSEEDTLRMKGAFFVTMGGTSIAPAYRIPSSIPNILSSDAYLQLARTNTKGQRVEVGKIRKLARARAQAVAAAAAVEAGEMGFEETVELVEPEDPDRSEPEGESGSLLGPARREPEEFEEADKVERGGEREEEEKEEEKMIINQDFVHYREVQDKGKAEMLGKALVCLQALWMLVQCVVRKASGLPVTLLEIHVAMHVICAIGMYAFWFNKPQDVGEPLPIGVISDPGQLRIELVNQCRRFKGGLKLGIREGEINLNGPDTEYGSVRPSPGTKSVLFLTPRSRTAPPPIADSSLLKISPSHMLDIGPVRIYNDLGKHHDEALVTPGDLRFFRQAAGDYNAGKRPKFPRVSLSLHVSTVDSIDILDDVEISNVSPALFILLLYGACHAAAWNTHFPSPVECLLWRISSIVIAVIPAYALFLRALYNNDDGDDALYRVFTLYIHELVRSVGYVSLPFTSMDLDELLELVIVFSMLIPVLCGRSYLFIESFLSLRSLPFGAFDSTPWEDYFPHF